MATCASAVGVVPATVARPDPGDGDGERKEHGAGQEGHRVAAPATLRRLDVHQAMFLSGKSGVKWSTLCESTLLPSEGIELAFDGFGSGR